MADRPPRPPALTLTCIFVGVGCGLLLVNLVSALSSWGSIELQDAVRDALAQEPVKELGLSMDQALDYLRYAVYVGIVLTASGAVFAVYAGPVATTTPTHPSAQPAPVGPVARPRSVTVAVVTTFVASGVVALLGLLLLLVTTVGADAYRTALTEPGLARDLVRSSGVSADEMIELLRVSAIVWLVACVAGVVAALAVVRRVPSGGTALVVVAAVTIGLSVFFLPLGVVTGAAAIVVIVQLRRPESRAWLLEE